MTNIPVPRIIISSFSTVLLFFISTFAIPSTNISNTQASGEVIELIVGSEDRYPDKLDYSFDLPTTFPSLGKKVDVFHKYMKTYNNDLYFVYIDQFIAKVDADSKTITKVLGGSKNFTFDKESRITNFKTEVSPEESYPGSLRSFTFNNNGDLYFTGEANLEPLLENYYFLRKIEKTTNKVSEIVGEYGDSFPTEPSKAYEIKQLASPTGSFDDQGNMYHCSFTDADPYGRVRKYNVQTKTSTLVAGGGAEELDTSQNNEGSFMHPSNISKKIATNVRLGCNDTEFSPDKKTLYIISYGELAEINIQTGMIKPVTSKKSGLIVDNITTDADGNIYALVIDNSNAVFIKKIDTKTLELTNIVGGGKFTDFKLNNIPPLEAGLDTAFSLKIVMNKEGTLFFGTPERIYQLKGASSASGVSAPSNPTISPSSSNTGSSSFIDVPSSHPYFDAIEFVKSKLIVQGYSDGSFKADIPINRAELTKIVIEATYPGEESGSNCFIDVLNDWSAPYICFGKSKNIVGGYPNGGFIGWNNVSFVEASKIILKALGRDIPEGDPWFSNYVQELANANAIPTSITKFTQEITRAEMSEIIYRLLENITNKPSKKYQELTF